MSILNERLCSICQSFMHTHPEQPNKYYKCPTCGNTVEIRKDTMKEIIKPEAFYMGRDKDFKDQLTEDLQGNAKTLLKAVNGLLTELGIEDAGVSSGWRPAAINKNVPGAAKKSLHQVCKAVDIIDDKDQTLANLIMANPDLLKKYGLWMEDPKSTKGKWTNWVHLDIGNRSDRLVRVFLI